MPWPSPFKTALHNSSPCPPGSKEQHRLLLGTGLEGLGLDL